MHRVWITPTSSAAAGMVQGMAPYSGSWTLFRFTTPQRTPFSSPT